MRVREAGTLTASWRIDGPGADAWSFTLPFAVWPVTLEVEDGFFEGSISPYVLPLAPFETFLDEPEITAQAHFLLGARHFVDHLIESEHGLPDEALLDAYLALIRQGLGRRETTR